MRRSGSPRSSSRYSGALPDTPQGGQGQPVDGIDMRRHGVQHTPHPHAFGDLLSWQAGCGSAGSSARRRFRLKVASTGFTRIRWTASSTSSRPCSRPKAAPGFQLGMFFDIWGQPLDARQRCGTQRAGHCLRQRHALRRRSARRFRCVSHQQIVLEIGTPTVPPPNYAFPPAD